NVYEGLQAARTTDVHIFGRRGPAQTKFSPLEARELALPHGVQVVMDPRDLEQISEEDWEAIRADRRTDQVVQTFVKWLEQQQARQAEGAEPTDVHGGPVTRRLHLHFWHRPVEILGEDGKVTGMRFERTRLAGAGRVEGGPSGRPGGSRARAPSPPAWPGPAASRAPASSSAPSWTPSTVPSATTAPSCPGSLTTPRAASSSTRPVGSPSPTAPSSPAPTPTAGSSAVRWV